jgi:uncharacterized protein with HEPN domain
MNKTDVKILEHILDYCLEINDTINFFGNSLDKFLNNKDYQKSIFFTIFQIGELSKRFSQKFVTETADMIPWKQYFGIRDRFAHGYLKMDFKIIWNTAINDIPKLYIFCDKKLKEIQTQDNQATVVK